MDDPRNPSISDLVAQTPTDRDRYVDFLRAASITVVVLGHWLVSVVIREGDKIKGTNALGPIRGLQIATWALQVMPVFFFVGGFSNLLAIEHQSARGWAYPEFLRRRMGRLLRPTLVFASVWLVLAAALGATDVDPVLLRFAAKIAAQPLWFLAVYLVVVAAAPVLLDAHRRQPVAPFLALAGAAIVVDVLRFNVDLVGFATVNYALVFLFAHQLGFLYADGVLTRISTRTLVVTAACATAVLVALTVGGPYPLSMVGVPGEAISNMSPPTVCILVLAIAQISVVMAARPVVASWLQGRQVWAATVAVNARIMTLFLWHLTALVGAAALLIAVGLPLPEAGAAGWWALRPVWVLTSACLLVGLILAFGWAEQLPAASDGARQRPTWPSLLGLALAVRGLIGLALTGFADVVDAPHRSFLWLRLSPLADVALLALGYLLVMGWERRARVRGRGPAVGPATSDSQP